MRHSSTLQIGICRDRERCRWRAGLEPLQQALKALNGLRSLCFKPFRHACGKSSPLRLVNEMTSETSSNDPFLVIAKYVQRAEILSEIGTWPPPLLGNA